MHSADQVTVITARQRAGFLKVLQAGETGSASRQGKRLLLRKGNTQRDQRVTHEIDGIVSVRLAQSLCVPVRRRGLRLL